MPCSTFLKSLTNTEFNSVPHYLSRILTTPYNTHTYSLILTTYLTHIFTSQNFYTSLFTPFYTNTCRTKGRGIHYLTKMATSCVVLGAVSAHLRPFKGGVNL